MEPFVFISDCHQRYENSVEVMELQHCTRTISVMENISGCCGYKLNPGDGYIVKIYNDDLGRPNMEDKPMRIVNRTADKIELQGYLIEAKTPYGWQEVDYRDYGLTVYYANNKVSKCVLHMFYRHIDIEYRNTETAKHNDHTISSSPQRWTKPVSLEILFKKSISFHVNRYEEWFNQRCISEGNLDFDLHLIASENSISVEIPEAARFHMHDNAIFAFKESYLLHDRLQYVNAPRAVKDPTRPIVLHVFVKNNKIDCVRFAMSFPDRIIEFYGYQIISSKSMESSKCKPHFEELAQQAMACLQAGNDGDAVYHPMYKAWRDIQQNPSLLKDVQDKALLGTGLFIFGSYGTVQSIDDRQQIISLAYLLLSDALTNRPGDLNLLRNRLLVMLQDKEAFQYTVSSAVKSSSDITSLVFSPFEGRDALYSMIYSDLSKSPALRNIPYLNEAYADIEKRIENKFFGRNKSCTDIINDGNINHSKVLTFLHEKVYKHEDIEF